MFCMFRRPSDLARKPIEQLDKNIFCTIKSYTIKSVMDRDVSTLIACDMIVPSQTI